MKIAVVGIALLGVAPLVLLGCSTDLSDGGTVKCNDTTIAEAVTGDPAFAEYVVADYTCADSWAFAAANPAEGQMGAPAMMIFEAEGPFWISKSAADVCGTYSDGTYPSDAMVPESLYDPACLAG